MGKDVYKEIFMIYTKALSLLGEGAQSAGEGIGFINIKPIDKKCRKNFREPEINIHKLPDY